MNKKKRCANPACRCFFIPNPRIKNQRYCKRKDCQRVRKRLWQRRKMKNDLDYTKNQRDSQKNWREHNPDYWKNYRSCHPEYVKVNRRLQKDRDKTRRIQALAKMDALKNDLPVKARVYRMFSGEKMNLAKMDASWQRIYLIPDG